VTRRWPTGPRRGPSGASRRDTHEAVELRDGGKRYLGKGVRPRHRRRQRRNLHGPVREMDAEAEAKDRRRDAHRLDGRRTGPTRRQCILAVVQSPRPPPPPIAHTYRYVGGLAARLCPLRLRTLSRRRARDNPLDFQNYDHAGWARRPLRSAAHGRGDFSHPWRPRSNRGSRTLVNGGDEGGFRPPDIPTAEAGSTS